MLFLVFQPTNIDFFLFRYQLYTFKKFPFCYTIVRLLATTSFKFSGRMKLRDYIQQVCVYLGGTFIKQQQNFHSLIFLSVLNRNGKLDSLGVEQRGVDSQKFFFTQGSILYKNIFVLFRSSQCKRKNISAALTKLLFAPSISSFVENLRIQILI